MESEMSMVYCPQSFEAQLGQDIAISNYATDGVNCALGSSAYSHGGGTMWAAMAEAYRRSFRVGKPLTSAQCLYLATVGGAKALGFDGEVGKLDAGFRADFQVLRVDRNPLFAKSFHQRLFT